MPELWATTWAHPDILLTRAEDARWTDITVTWCPACWPATGGPWTVEMRRLSRPAAWHLALPTTAPPKRAPEFLVTGLPCPDCACPVWLASTATDQEFRWFGRLFIAGSDDRYLLMCADCGGTMTAPSAKVND